MAYRRKKTPASKVVRRKYVCPGVQNQKVISEVTYAPKYKMLHS